MRKLMLLVPTLGCFGPLIIVLGIGTPYHILSYVGAVATSAAIVIGFGAVMQLLSEREKGPL